jgi:hypothetical protein
MIIFIACGGGKKTEEALENQRGKEAVKEKTFSTETANGILYVHNNAPVWGDDSKITLEPVAKVGRLEGKDENLSFYKPSDIALDEEGNLYVLDSGNHRIQKLSLDGSYLNSFGKKGQGPGEFQYMSGLELDSKGNMYVTDQATNTVKMLSPDGIEITSFNPGGKPTSIGLFKSGDMLFKNTFPDSASLAVAVNQQGQRIGEFGQIEPYDDFDYLRYFNRIVFTLDQYDSIYIAYATRNKIEKYSKSGNLMLSIDRPLNYEISKEITYEDKQFGPRKIKIPFVNFVSAGIAVDDKDRVWVLSYDRQLKFDEMGFKIVFRDGDGRFEGSQNLKTSDSLEIDAFVFHVFNKEGHFLGNIPINHHGGITRVFKNRLYILEPKHEMCVYIYKVVEK